MLTVGKQRTGRLGGGLVGSTATKLRWARSGESRKPEELRYPSVSQSAVEESWHEAKAVPSLARQLGKGCGVGEADGPPIHLPALLPTRLLPLGAYAQVAEE